MMDKIDKLRESAAMKDLFNTPFDARGQVDRKQLGPMTRGYIEGALSDPKFVFHDINDIDEATLQQMIRDCVGFYWSNNALLEALWSDPFSDYTQKDTGKDFWLSRASLEGFLRRSDPFDGLENDIWDELDKRAKGMGLFLLDVDEDGTIKAQMTGWYQS